MSDPSSANITSTTGPERTVKDSGGHDLILGDRCHSHNGRDQCPSTHGKHTPSSTPALTDQTANDDSGTETDIVQAVEQGEPRRRDAVLASVGIPFAKLGLKCLHGLSVVVGCIVETIIERRDGNDGEGYAKMAIEVF